VTTQLINQAGIKVNYSDNVVISNNSLSNFHANSFAILLGQDAETVTITGNNITLNGDSQVGLRLHTGSVSFGNIIDGGIGYSGAIAIDVKEGTGALISDTKIIGSWIAPPVVVRDPAIDSKFHNVTITEGSTGWQFDFKGSTRPVVQSSNILAGSYGINLGTSSGARILNNKVKVTNNKYMNWGGSTNFTIIDDNDLGTQFQNDVTIGASNEDATLIMHSPDGSAWKCEPDNVGDFFCISN
jgi:hypothetical protein